MHEFLMWYRVLWSSASFKRAQLLIILLGIFLLGLGYAWLNGQGIGWLMVLGVPICITGAMALEQLSWAYKLSRLRYANIMATQPPDNDTTEEELEDEDEEREEESLADYSEEGTDMRSVTLAALNNLPNSITEVPAPDFEGLSIPLLYDGSAWEWLELAAGNHTGVFGMTRSGKGNAVQHILLQALTFGPELIRAIVLDAKGGLDYAFCDDLEHAELYSDKAISDGLQVALTEMERRKALLRAGRYRNHYEYQQKTGKTLSLVIVIADELTQFSDAQNAQLVTLACVSGAMGFLLLLATQHPLAKYLPTSVQANVGNRLVFRLASSEQIRIAMKRTRDDEGTYNPALIGTSMKGVGVLRGPGGEEFLGRVPEVTDVARDALIAELVTQWPKTASVSAEPVPPLLLHFERDTSGTTTGTTPELVPEPALQEAVIETLLLGRMSKNKIAAHFGGNRQRRLFQINEIEARLRAEGRLKEE